MRAQGKVPYLYLYTSGCSSDDENDMRIIVNGTGTDVDEQTSLQAYLVHELIADKPGMAIAVNETVIPRKEWPDCMLKSGDSILIIKATQGG